LLLVDGNPLDNINLIADPKNFKIIMKDGTIYKKHSDQVRIPQFRDPMLFVDVDIWRTWPFGYFGTICRRCWVTSSKAPMPGGIAVSVERRTERADGLTRASRG